MIQQAEALAPQVGLQPACAALGVPRSSLYAARQPKLQPPAAAPAAPVSPANALTPAEKQAVLAELNSARFADQTPYEIYAQLLDEQRYLCSPRTFYRILAENQAVGDRRRQLRHPTRKPPQLVARQPNQVWVWDITKLPGTLRYQCFYLYLVLDLFSRFIIGWLIADRQSGDYAKDLLAAGCERFAIAPQQLTVHSDNGSPMTAKPMEWLFADLGIHHSLSRPHVANDNPHAEASFKTAKYHPTYPERFDNLVHAQSWMRGFEHWYCHEHHHTALGLMTPATIHFGQADELWLQRQAVLQAAYQAHPERFSRGQPTPARWAGEVWINAPHKALALPAPGKEGLTDRA